MAVVLHYFAPNWVTSVLEEITALPVQPLSIIERLLLQNFNNNDLNQYINENFVLETLGALSPQPWAARLLQEQAYPSVDAYSWMAVFPGYYSIQLRSTSYQRIALPSSLQPSWLDLLQACLPEPQWRIIFSQHMTLIGYALKHDAALLHAGVLETHPVWLKAKAEIEMELFSRRQQGEDWQGINGIEALGSGALPVHEERTHDWTQERWTIWCSENPFWQSLGKSYGICPLANFQSVVLNKAAGSVWVDLASSSIQESDAALAKGVQAWVEGTVAKLKLISCMQHYSYTFELPSWPWWKRRIIHWKLQHQSEKQQQELLKQFLTKIGYG